MLYLIYGTNSNKVRSKQKELINIMQSKQPDVSLYKVTTENWENDIVDELLSSQGLFLSKYIVSLDRVLEDKEISGIVLDNLKEFKESSHAWIIVEEKVTAAVLKKIEKYAYKIFDFNEVVVKKEKLNAFGFAEKFASRNKVGAWTSFIELKDAELVGEEIHGVLWWQMKSVYLAKMGKTASDTGLAPYSYQKALVFAKNWELKDLNIILDNLIRIYHDAHRGGLDLMIEIEKMSLSI